MKKTRVLALILMLAMLVQIMPTTLGVSAAANDTIVLYPEYPEKIERDYMYRVYVSQGGEEYEIPVYNSMRHSNHYVRGDQGTYSDVDRRFCQFSATPTTSNPVTIKVVANTDFTKYSIIPSSKAISSTIVKNEITFDITESGQYVFRLNDNNLTNLAIFADAVETESPSTNKTVVRYNKNNPAPNKVSRTGSVVYIIEDWQDVEFFELRSNQELYIAPGAVLNSRILVLDGQSNVKIFGRGMLRDFNDSRAYNSNGRLQTARDYNYILTVGSSWNKGTQLTSNVNIKDIILFDSKGFNLVFQGTQNCTADNIKIVSNEISTDGVSIWGSDYITIKNSYLYVADNAFVIDQATSLKLDNLLVGTSIATFFPQSGIEGAHEYKNINVFRSATIMEPASGFTNTIYGAYAKGTILIENLSAIDCVAPVDGSGTSKMGKLFATYSSATNSSANKVITFKNLTLPETNNSYAVDVGVKNAKAGNYSITIKNAYVGTTALTQSNVKFTDSTTSGKPSTLSVSNDGTYSPIIRNVTEAYYSANESYIRDDSTGTIYFAPTAPYSKNGTVYVSAKTTAEKLGFKTYFDADDNSLTVYDDNLIVRATVGSKNVVYNDSLITLSAPVEYGEEVMVPVEFFQKTIAPESRVNGKNAVIGTYDRGNTENLVINGDFEDKNALESWTTINFSILTRSTNSYSGSYGLRFLDPTITNRTSATTDTYWAQGAYQDVRDLVRANGPGVYRISFWAKCNESGKTDTDLTDTSKYNIATTVATGWMSGSPLGGAKTQTLTTSWKQYTQDVFIAATGSRSVTAKELYAAITIKGALDVSVDDFTFTKVSNVTNSSGTPLYTITTDVDTDNAGDYSLDYGVTGKTVSISGTNADILNLTFETASDYITVDATRQTASDSTNTTKASIEVAYPSNYDRVARVYAVNASGTVVAEIVIKIPATTTDKHVLDFATNLVVNDTYTVGEALDTSTLKLTNVLYNDGTTGTVTDSSKIRVTGADFSTAGKKTITVSYDNKSVTYTTTVKAPAVTNDAKLKTLGANIRLETDELSAGIRFAATFEKNDLYDTYYPTSDSEKMYIYSENNNYQFGAIMVPTSLIPSGEDVVSMYQSGNSTVLEALGKRVYAQDSETLTFTGVLVGIPETVKDYTNVIQTAFYVRYRESETDDWTYIFSTKLEDSYYSVATKAAEKTYNYTNLPNPTAGQKRIIDALNKIIDFVEEDNWIDGDWW